jgi:hypothetical protein
MIRRNCKRRIIDAPFLAFLHITITRNTSNPKRVCETITAGEDCSMGVAFAGNAWISLAKVFGDLKEDIIRRSQDLRLNVCYLNRRIIGIALIKSRKPQMEKI